MKILALSILTVLVIGLSITAYAETFTPEPQRIDTGVDDSDRHLPAVFISHVNAGGSIGLFNAGYESVDVTGWYVITKNGDRLNVDTADEEPIPPCESEYFSTTGTGGIIYGDHLTLYNENKNKIDQTGIISINRYNSDLKLYQDVLDVPVGCAETSHTDTVWISEIETNPLPQDDRGREWVILTNGQNEPAYIKNWKLIGTSDSYTINDEITIEPCGSEFIRLDDITIENENERLLLVDDENKLVDRTPYFTDSVSSAETIKYEPPKCADSIDDISIPENHSLVAKVEELERIVSMLLNNFTTSTSSNPTITTGVTGNVNTDFGTIVAISTNDLTKQTLAAVIDGKYTIFLEPGNYLIQVVGSDSYQTVTVNGLENLNLER